MCRAHSYLPNNTLLYSAVVYRSCITFSSQFLHSGAPNITTPPGDLTVVSPDDVTFTCLVTGSPRPDITWMMNDNGSLVNIPGAANVDYQISEEEIGGRERMSALTLLDSQPSDAGEYVCVGINNIAHAQESGTLVVQGIIISILKAL